jgi:predicted metal-dependent peptidase
MPKCLHNQIEAAFERIRKARAALVLAHPFFAALALRLEIVPHGTPAIATDGRRLLFNPDWVAQRSDSHLLTAAAHAAMHCALGHPFRRSERDPEIWNQACDNVVNNLLLRSGFELPVNAPCELRFADPKLASEHVYSILYGERSQTGQADEEEGEPAAGSDSAGEPQPGRGAAENGQQHDYGGMGEVLDATAEDGSMPSEADLSAQERDWQVAVYQAAQVAKGQGNCPGNIHRLIDGMREPKVDWRSRLREFIRSLAANDYTWRPNVRHIAHGDYFPSLCDETTGPLVIGVDTSGSMSDGELSQIAAEINSVLDTVRPERIDVVYCDTQVTYADVFRPEDYPIHMDARGGGGTSMAPIWPYVAPDVFPHGDAADREMVCNYSDR